MGSHQSSKMISDSWITPKYILDALGEFHLDPCVADDMPWKTALNCFTKKANGLKLEWYGRVWLNPPYSNQAVLWLRKLAIHGNGIALTFARTETRYFFETIWEKAHAVLFLRGRIYFHYPNGIKAPANAGAPSVLIAYGEKNADILRSSGIDGIFIDLKSNGVFHSRNSRANIQF